MSSENILLAYHSQIPVLLDWHKICVYVTPGCIPLLSSILNPDSRQIYTITIYTKFSGRIVSMMLCKGIFVFLMFLVNERPQ